MSRDDHYRLLERLYHAAPTNEYYRPRIVVSDGHAEIRATVREEFLHAAGAVHGSVYFKLLDDAAFFAANSRIDDVFVLTASFNLYFLRPVSSGELHAVGRLVNPSRRLLLAESQLFDDRERLIAHGTGQFAISDLRLDELDNRAQPPS